MSFLKDFEKKLEELVEVIFTKGFRSGVQPVELAKKLVREMDENRTVSVSKVYVPNHYTFFLSPPDKEEFSSFESQLVLELKEFLEKEGRARNYTFIAPPQIHLEGKNGLTLGEVELRSKLVAPVEPDRRGDFVPQSFEKKDDSSHPGADIKASLVLVIKGKEEEIYFLTKDETTIGRLEGNDIIIPDPSVSRHHAEIKRENNNFFVLDLESTNGTWIDGKRISKAPLKDGARIELGKVLLEFRRF
jgi:hypothetical protein